MELFFYSTSLPRCRAYSKFTLAMISARSKNHRTHDRILLTKAYDGRALLKNLNLVIISYCDYFLLLGGFGTRSRIGLLIFDQFYFFTVGRHQRKSWKYFGFFGLYYHLWNFKVHFHFERLLKSCRIYCLLNKNLIASLIL